MAFYKYTPKTNGDRYSICKTLFGCQTYFYKCVGYCQKKGKYLTTKQLKNKGCLKKQCKCLVKLEDRTFWKLREQKKNKA